MAKLLWVTLLAVLCAWLAVGQKKAPPSQPPSHLTPGLDQPPHSPEFSPKIGTKLSESPGPQFYHTPTTLPESPPAVVLETISPLWEQQLSTTIAKAPDRTSAARAVFNLLPLLPEEALESATEQALEKLPDSKYKTVALPILLNPQTHGRVLSILFADLMERPDPIALPTLLQLTKDSSHPFSPFAMENLQLLLGEDSEPGWSKWAVEIQKQIEFSPLPQ